MEPQVPLPRNAVPDAKHAVRRTLRIALPLVLAATITAIGLLVYFELVSVLLLVR